MYRRESVNLDRVLALDCQLRTTIAKEMPANLA